MRVKLFRSYRYNFNSQLRELLVGIINTQNGADKIVKSELINETWKTTLNKEFKKTDVENIINAFLKTLGNELKNNCVIKIDGFGTFSSSVKKSYLGKNINTGITEIIPSSRYINFKPSKKIKN